MLHYLGFDPETINEAARNFNPDGPDITKLSLDSKPIPAMSKEAEKIVNEALLVGNFEAAVECCFHNGNLADALVLASCGGPELWAKTQTMYFASEARKRPFLSIVSAVIHKQVSHFVCLYKGVPNFVDCNFISFHSNCLKKLHFSDTM